MPSPTSVGTVAGALVGGVAQRLALHVQAHGEVPEEEVAQSHPHDHRNEDGSVVGHDGQHEEVAEHALKQEDQRLLRQLHEPLPGGRIEEHDAWWGCGRRTGGGRWPGCVSGGRRLLGHVLSLLGELGCREQCGRLVGGLAGDRAIPVLQCDQTDTRLLELDGLVEQAETDEAEAEQGEAPAVLGMHAADDQVLDLDAPPKGHRMHLGRDGAGCG